MLATCALRRVAVLAAGVVLVVALGACTRAAPSGASGSNTTRDDDDPFVVRGSVTGGATRGSLPGPYSPDK